MNSRSKVLIVDDNPEDLAAYSRYLLRSDRRRLTVATAASVAAAFDLMPAFRPDCLVVDYDLGDESGLDLLTRLHELGELPPTLILTDAGNERIAVEFFRRGASDYLRKSGTSADAFCAAVENLLAARDMQLEVAARRHDNSKAARALAEAVERSSFLARASARLAATLEIRELLDLVAALPIPFIGDVCIIDLVEEHGVYRRAVALGEGELERSLGSRLEGLAPDIDAHAGVSAVLRTRTPSYYDGPTLQTVARFDPDVADLRKAGLAVLAVIPLIYDDRTIGAISVGSVDPARLSGDHRSLIEEYAQRAAVAIANARVVEAERHAREEAEGAKRRLSFLSRVSMLFARSLDWEMTLARLVKTVVPLFSDIAAVYMADGPGDTIRCIAVEASRPALREAVEKIGAAYPLSISDVAGTGRAIRTGRSEFYADALRLYERVARDDEHMKLVRSASVSSFISVPLAIKGEILGALTFTRDESKPRFAVEDLSLVEDLARRASAYLENARLYERQRSIASALQHSLLPDRLPSVDGLEAASRYIAGAEAMEVGGDWYDVIPVSDSRIVIAIGDVVGRGVLAAAAMGQLRTLLRAYAFENFEPAIALGRLNALVTTTGDERFATMFFLVLDPQTGRLTYACAGHPPLLMRAPDGTVTLLEGRQTMPVGVWPATQFAQDEVTLAPGTTLLLYTDGLIETRERGIAQGLALLAGTIASGPDELNALLDHALAIVAPDRSDDIAMLAIRFVGSGDPLRRAWRLPSIDAATAHALRAEFAEYLERHATRDSDIFSAQLIVGELIGNVVRYAQGPLHIELDWTAPSPVLHVRDHGPGFGYEGARRLPDDPLAMNGRGLFLVEHIAERFEVAPHPEGGMETVVVLPVRRTNGTAPH